MYNFIEGLPTLEPLSAETTDHGRFYTLPDGSKVPSVTTILGHFEQAGLNGWRNAVGIKESNAVSHHAKSRGTAFHAEIEAELLSKSMPKMMPHVKELFTKIKKNLTKYVSDIYYIEAPLYSYTLGTAGRTDLIAHYDGELAVIDFKTSSKVKSPKDIIHYFEQLTAYNIMVRELTGIKPVKLVCIIANEEEPEAQVFIHQLEINQFEATLLDKIKRYKEVKK